MTRLPQLNLSSLLVDSATRFPTHVAVARGKIPLHTYGELARRVARQSAAMLGGGLCAGDRAAIASRNTCEYIETMLACWHAGACAVPVNAKLHPDELVHILNDCGAKWMFVDAAWESSMSSRQREVPRVERVVRFGSVDYAALFTNSSEREPAAVDDRDAAWLFYTSGTTGKPKGVVLSHGNLRAMSRCFVDGVETIDPGDTILHCAPLSHGSGLYLVPHIACAAAHVVPGSGGFDAAELVELLGSWRGVCLFAAPTMVKRLVEHPSLPGAKLDHLKSVVFGGGPMYVEDCKTAFHALGPRLAQIYGQGESPMTITAMRRSTLADAVMRGDDARLESVGTPQPGIEVRIAGQDLELPGSGGVGEVLVRGPTVMQGYWQNGQASAAALAGGWLHTGDVGCLDADGYLTLKDRSKDLIISGGSNIYPREIEEVLLKHPGVVEAAVVGRRHAEWGEEVVAVVVARSGVAQRTLRDELDGLCLDRIARFKRPRDYVFVAELPKNNNGKVVKTALREMVAVPPSRVS
jgi:long-chain acyl-CoA synthetase